MPSTLLLTFLLLAGGGAVWLLVGWRAVRREPVIAGLPRKEPAWGTGVVVAMLCFVGFQLVVRLQSELALLDAGPRERTVTVGAIQSACAYNALLVVVLLLFLTEAGRKSAADFGVHAQQVGNDAIIGTAGFFASFPPVYLVVLLTAGLRSEERTHSFVTLARANPSWEVYVWIGLAVVITAPLAEELLFRVILQGWLRTKLPAVGAIGVSSILFCAVHGFPDSLALLPLALILGYVFEHRRSYIAVVVLHALFNAQTLLALLLGELEAV